jgi:hypothetical protein
MRHLLPCLRAARRRVAAAVGTATTAVPTAAVGSPASSSERGEHTSGALAGAVGKASRCGASRCRRGCRLRSACSQRAPDAALLVSVAMRLERAQARGAGADDKRAMRALERLLECAVACTTLHLPPFLGVLTRSLKEHPALLAGAQHSPAFMRDARALLARAATVEATYTDSKEVSQLAAAQSRLHVSVDLFWRHLATKPLELDSQGLANLYHAHATLARLGVDIHEVLCTRLERTAASLAGSMTPQAVANVLWAAAEVRKPEYGSAAVSMLPAPPFMAAVARRAEHVACAMKPQAVAMTLSALANLNEGVLPSLRAALLRAAQRVAAGMNAQTECAGKHPVGFGNRG